MAILMEKTEWKCIVPYSGILYHIAISMLFFWFDHWCTLVVRIFAGAVWQGKCSFLLALVLWFEPQLSDVRIRAGRPHPHHSRKSRAKLQLSDERVRAGCPHPHHSHQSPATVRRAGSCWVSSSALFSLVSRKYPSAFQVSTPVPTQILYREIGKVITGIVPHWMPARESCLTPRSTPGVEPELPRAVPTGGSDVGALRAQPGMPQTHIYARHT